MTPADLQFADRTQMTLHLARTPGLPEWMRPELDARFAKNRLRLARLREAFAEASHALRDLEFVVLKGFTHHWFGIDPEARVQHDIDLLLQPDSLEAATKALTSIGYRPHGRELSREHTPPLVRPFTWEWRGDWYDPDLPISLELHTTIWDSQRDRIRFPEVKTFWDRRQGQQLDPHDIVAFAALHGLRHTLRNNIKPASLYELSVLLRRLASDEAWWAEWNHRYDYDFRLLQAVAFRFASEWFDAPRAPFELPPQIEQWFDQAGWSPIDALFEPNKETLRLHLMLLRRWRDRAHVIQDRLLPLKIPHEKGRARHHLETALKLLLKKSHRSR